MKKSGELFPAPAYDTALPLLAVPAGVRAVELFAGIGGFRLACDDLGIETVWANDFSSKAAQVYRSRFGSDVLVESDIHGAKTSIPSHDLLTAGFPCQPFSSAGKKRGIADPRGTLFQVIVDVIRAHHPRWFVLENVKRLLSMERGVHFATILNALTDAGYLVEWRLLNASDFGLAQNRQRVFIVGTLNRMSQNPSISIRLSTHEEMIGLPVRAKTLMRTPGLWPSLGSHGQRFPAWGIANQQRFFGHDLGGLARIGPIPTLDDVLQAPKDVDPRFFFNESTRARIKDSEFVGTLVQGVRILYNQRGGARMGYTVFGVDGLAPTLTSTASRHYERYMVGRDLYRRLTHVEYARLQGFPDDHCSAVSSYHQYALFGNAVPPPLAVWAISRMLGSEIEIADSSGAAGSAQFSSG